MHDARRAESVDANLAPIDGNYFFGAFFANAKTVSNSFFAIGITESRLFFTSTISFSAALALMVSSATGLASFSTGQFGSRILCWQETTQNAPISTS